MLYPLKFAPILKSKIWGGDRINKLYRHDSSTLTSIGESWEVSGMEGDDSVVINGFLRGNSLSELVEVYMGDLVGEHVYDMFGSEFPLLVKLLDAKDNLSVQVHPTDAMAEENGLVRAKNELWYVVDAEKNSSVIAGFEVPVDEELCRNMLEAKTLGNVLHRISVKKGDAIFIPAGCVHSIEPGCFILEIQQTSDVTYRLYDYDRRDADGNCRQLHIDEAMCAIDWQNWRNDKLNVVAKSNQMVTLLDRPCFTSNLMEIDVPKEYELAMIDSFVILTCVSGHVTLKFDNDYLTLTDAESVLIPAEMTSLTIVPTVPSRLIESYIK